MKINKFRLFSLLSSVAALLFFAHSYATGNFVKISLPQDVSIELPKNWIIISNDQRITLDTWAESGLDLANLDYVKSNLPFAANYYQNGKVSGIVNARYYPKSNVTQSDVRQLTNEDIKYLDAQLKESVDKAASAFGGDVLSWEGTTRITINGITALVTEYHRKALSTGVFRVRLVRVFDRERTFTLTVSYNEDKGYFLKTISDRIIQSLMLSGINKTSAVTTRTYEKTKNADSVMSLLYGENWVAVFIISALLTWGIGLAPPLLIRFVFVKRPIGVGWAIGVAILFLFINVLLFAALDSTNKTHGVLLLVAGASYAILRKGSNKSKY